MENYRVYYIGPDGDTKYSFFPDMEQAQAFYDSLGGKATIQKWDPEWSAYIDVLYPMFEY